MCGNLNPTGGQEPHRVNPRRTRRKAASAQAQERDTTVPRVRHRGRGCVPLGLRAAGACRTHRVCRDPGPSALPRGPPSWESGSLENQTALKKSKHYGPTGTVINFLKFLISFTTITKPFLSPFSFLIVAEKNQDSGFINFSGHLKLKSNCSVVNFCRKISLHDCA